MSSQPAVSQLFANSQPENYSNKKQTKYWQILLTKKFKPLFSSNYSNMTKFWPLPHSVSAWEWGKPCLAFSSNIASSKVSNLLIFRLFHDFSLLKQLSCICRSRYTFVSNPVAHCAMQKQNQINPPWFQHQLISSDKSLAPRNQRIHPWQLCVKYGKHNDDYST